MEIRYTIGPHKVGTVAVIMALMLLSLMVCCKGRNGRTRVWADVATSCQVKAHKVKGRNRVQSIRYP